MRAFGRFGVNSSGSGSLAKFSNKNFGSRKSMASGEHGHIHMRNSISLTHGSKSEEDESPLHQTWYTPDDTADTDSLDQQQNVRSTVQDLSKGQMSVAGYSNPSATNTSVTVVTISQTAAAKAKRAAMRKMLLLNGYPVLYVILWIPGISNRVVEAVGTSPTWLKALQCSTQLVGFANAMTYAYNEQLVQRVRQGREEACRRRRAGGMA